MMGRHAARMDERRARYTSATAAGSVTAIYFDVYWMDGKQEPDDQTDRRPGDVAREQREEGCRDGGPEGVDGVKPVRAGRHAVAESPCPHHGGPPHHAAERRRPVRFF